jgi:hypothetical protein
MADTITIGWLDSDTAKNYLKDELAKSFNETLNEHWDSIIIRSMRRAYYDIIQAFSWRGYQSFHIIQWDRGLEFQIDLMLWYCLMNLAGLQPDRFNTNAISKLLDRRVELSGDFKSGIVSSPLLINGVIISPDNNLGEPNTGVISNNGDFFKSPDLNDPRLLDIVTRF